MQKGAVTKRASGTALETSGSKREEPKSDLAPTFKDALPEFNALAMSDNFRRFVITLDPLVHLVEFGNHILSLADLKDTFLFLFVATLGILYFE